jgi:hypothetical protein
MSKQQNKRGKYSHCSRRVGKGQKNHWKHGLSSGKKKNNETE